MSDLALLVLESPWERPTNGRRRLSVLPFFEGLEKTHPHLAVYYATFYNTASLQASLSEDLLLAREARQVIYLGAHGSPRRVGEVRLDALRRTLESRAGQMQRVEGMIISSCEVFASSDDLLQLLKVSGLRWAVSYNCAVDWFDSMLVELAILNALAREPDTTYRRSQEGLKQFFRRAVSLLNLAHPLEYNGKGAIADHLLIAVQSRSNTLPQLVPLSCSTE